MVDIPQELPDMVKEAVYFFWSTRNNQGKKQSKGDLKDKGNRSLVTGGKQLDGFVNLIKDILIKNGVNEKSIYTESNLELPGYYRPNKKWDLLLIDEGKLLAAIELKSQVGPSFGNNFNNRTEEAMGSALDIWTAYREGAFGMQPSPWLGYIMVLEDCEKSSTGVKNREPHFKVFDEFIDASYKKRYEIFCRKLMLERQYAHTCFLTTNYNNGNPTYEFPDVELSIHKFISSLLGVVLAHKN